MSAEFVHLRLHSEYSVTDSTVRILQGQKQSLVDAVNRAGHQAVALGDEMNLFGIVQFYQAVLKHQIKPIVSADVRVSTQDGVVIVPLFVINANGYKQLCRILTKACCADVESPVIDFADLANNCSDLIAFCGGLKGAIAQRALKDFDSIDRVIQPWLDIFKGRFYLEIQRLGFEDEQVWIERSVELSQRYQLPLVATNPVRFINASDWDAHETRVCISNHSLSIGSDEIRTLYSPNQYYRSTEDMVELFRDLPSAITNTCRVAQRCNFELQLNRTQLPLFEVPENISLGEYFQKICYQGLENRLQELQIKKDKQQPYYERLEKEREIIKEMDYIGYFLIVADFIQWAKYKDIPVGPGRGSGAGSLVAFCLCITDVDPMKYGLIFERFLNPDRKSLPDFDIDFCQDGRDEVIQYVTDKYGADQVSQIVALGRLGARAVVRDVARVQGLPYGVGDRVAKLIPKEPDITLNQALEQSEELKCAFEAEEEVRNIIHSSLEIEGLVRNVGKHAAGVVIAPTRLENFFPVYHDSKTSNFFVSQFDKDAIEKMGLVKFDFLGLGTLTVIKWAVEWANDLLVDAEEKVDISRIPYNDSAVFDLLSKGMTDGIFQLVSSGVKRYIKKLKPTCLEDMVAMVALYRPGPLNSGMVDNFIKRKNGEVEIEVHHKLMEPILRETYGTIVYQEQVMQIAQKMANYTLSSADDLRKAMGKKDRDLMQNQQDKFIDGSVANGVDREAAITVFDLIKEFSEYGFNKSHSVAYAVLAYQSAWLKVHHTGAFYAALLSGDMDNHDKVSDQYRSTKQLNLVFKQVNVNTSTYKFSLLDKKTIIWALGEIKGVGKDIVDLIEQGRADGEYRDFFDFCIRARAHQIGKRCMERLIDVGAMDCFKQGRLDLLANIKQGIQFSQKYMDNQAVGQGDLFAQHNQQPSIPNFIKSKEYVSRFEFLEKERKYLGVYIHQSPYDILSSQLKALGAYSVRQLLAKFQEEHQRTSGQKLSVKLFAMVEKPNGFTIRKGKGIHNETKRFDLRVGDGISSVECFINDEKLVSQYQDAKFFNKDYLLILHGRAQFVNYRQAVYFEITQVESIKNFRTRVLKKFKVRVPLGRLSDLYQMLRKTQNTTYPDGVEEEQRIEVTFEFITDKGRLSYGSKTGVSVGNELISLLSDCKDIEVDWNH